ncbi:DHH family phosphoesterase [Dokdonia sp.]|uniref:DHH family phosphoesterase n=1 Tax=Dokdonia sp. TaxID=2024995 RepID=UPI003265DC54
MTILYHSRDLDGWCSAAIVQKWFYEQDRQDPETLQLIGWDYGDPIPIIEKGEPVVVVDISFEAEVMSQLNNTNNLIWIDHHISAIRDMEAHTIHPKGKRDANFAACELAWTYFFEDPMPEFVRLLGRYDCLAYKDMEEAQQILEFQYAARAYFKNPEDCFHMLQQHPDASIKTIPELFKLGKGIYNYLCTEAALDYKNRFTIDFDGYTFAAFNKKRFNPIHFGIAYHNDTTDDGYYYDGVCSFWLHNGKWNFSLYNDNGLVDCSEICKKRGGGGHAEAAGFQLDIHEIAALIKKTL